MDDLASLRARTRRAIKTAVRRDSRYRYARREFYRGAFLGWAVTSCFVLIERLV